MNAPTQDGYYWLRVHRSCDWQIVEFRHGVVRWFRAGKMRVKSLEHHHPDAEWGELIEHQATGVSS